MPGGEADVQNTPESTQQQQALPGIPLSCLFPGGIHATELSNTKKGLPKSQNKQPKLQRDILI